MAVGWTVAHVTEPNILLAPPFGTTGHPVTAVPRPGERLSHQGLEVLVGEVAPDPSGHWPICTGQTVGAGRSDKAGQVRLIRQRTLKRGLTSLVETRECETSLDLSSPTQGNESARDQWLRPTLKRGQTLPMDGKRRRCNFEFFGTVTEMNLL